MQHISSAKKVGVRILCGACLAMPLTSAFAADISDVNLDWGGYAKLAVLFSHFQDGAVQQGIGRDFYVPNTTPVLAPGANEVPHNYLDFQAKETRLFLKGSSNVQGHQVGGYVEMDFLSDQNLVNTTVTTTTPGASEATTNAYTPSLRRAYLTVDNWLLGQDWTTFQNVSALPDVVDYIGPTEGTVFVRQPLIRYTLGGLQVALENPETTTAAHAGAAFSNTDDNSIPDLVLRYNLKAGPGTYSFAALGRQLTDHGEVNGANGTTTGFGLSASGKVMTVGQDDLRFMVSGGSGIGRYLGLDTVGDTVADSTGQLDRSRIVNGFAAYRHVWNNQWRSSLVLSTLHADKDSNYAGTVTHNVSSASANLMYSPFTKMTVGGELRYAQRATMNDEKGSMSRAEFMAKYEF